MQSIRTLKPPQAPLPPRVESGRLGALRRIAGEARLSRFEEPEAACALLREQPAAAAEAYAGALLRLLPKALGQRVVFHRPGARECSFDELWTLGLIGAVERGDSDNLNFALASRVASRFRAPVRFLAEGLAARIDSLPVEPI